MDRHILLTSLTRIAPLRDLDWSPRELPFERWDTGDYVVCEAMPAGMDSLELETGRMVSVARGVRFVGALGERQATLEATGSWREAGKERDLQVLTSAGLLGKVTSKSPLLPELMSARYAGHVMVGKRKAVMRDFVPEVEPHRFAIPTVLLTATSMSTGKTTAATVIVRRLKHAGHRVLGAKIVGAGRYRDILAMGDAGADWIYDFVDAGLPSTVVPGSEYREALDGLLSRMAAHPADVAVVEIGASPLEPYNGVLAVEALRDVSRCTVLAASDAYAAAGLMHDFDLKPDFVCGPAVNTAAGVALVEKLCAVAALNVMDAAAIPRLDRVLQESLRI